MTFRQLKIATTQNYAESLSNLLTLMGAVSVSFEDAQDEPIYEPPPGSTPLWQTVRVVALFDSSIAIFPLMEIIEEQLGASQPLEYQTQLLIDQDWANAWKQHFHAMQFGKKLWICPSHEEISDPQAIKILLDPGLAFGTGTHPTTALCLTWLAEHIQSGETIIDFGCGSGILAIAALKLGAAKAYAIDNDPQALTACRENALRNEIKLQDLLISPIMKTADIQCDVLIANILANPIISLVEQFAALMKKNGTIVLSGILDEQAKAVTAAYEPWFVIDEKTVQEGWVRLSGKKR